MNGHRRVIAWIHARQVAEQFVESSSFVREAAGDHVGVVRCAAEVIATDLGLGQVGRQLIEQPLKGAGIREGDRRSGERAAQRAAVQPLPDEDAVGRVAIAVRDRQVSREQPMWGVQRLDPVRPHDFEEDPPLTTAGFYHGASAGAICPDRQPHLATAHAQVGEQRADGVGIDRRRQARKVWIEGPTPDADAHAVAVHDRSPLTYPASGGHHQRLAGDLPAGPAHLRPVLDDCGGLAARRGRLMSDLSRPKGEQLAGRGLDERAQRSLRLTAEQELQVRRPGIVGSLGCQEHRRSGTGRTDGHACESSRARWTGHERAVETTLISGHPSVLPDFSRGVSDAEGMPHSHTRVDPATDSDDPAAKAQQRRALKLMAAALIPVALATVLGLFLLWPSGTSEAQRVAEQYFPEGTLYPTGEVVAIEPYDCGVPGTDPEGGISQTCATATVTVEDGPEANENVRLDLPPDVYGAGIEPGVRVVMNRAPVGDPDARYSFNDFARGFPIALLALAFAIAVIAVARMRGLASILGLTFAFIILLEFMLPGLLAGSSPVLIGLVGSSAIMLVVLYLAHGFSARTTTALIGTLFGLGMVTALGALGQSAARVTGQASEENIVLAGFAAELDLSGLVLCGTIVAGLGVLNDVTITQASAVWELHQISPELPASSLFASAMRIGRDHIASTVYTIVFAYAGASLPLLLLFEIYQRPVLDIVTSGVIAEEVVRTLVGAIGLILAVPVTTAIGVAIVKASSAAPICGDLDLIAATRPQSGPKTTTTSRSPRDGQPRTRRG